MQRSGAATRRFYAAFYQWTVRSANLSRPCAANFNTVSRRRNSTTSETHKGGTAKSPISRTRPGNAKGFVGTAELLRNEPIQSPAERPVGSLHAWDHAVREKSENSVTVEISVPSWVLRAKDVTKRAQVHEVRVGVPEHKNGTNDDSLCPVLLSGEPSDVKAVWKSIYYTAGVDSRGPPQQPLAKPAEAPASDDARCPETSKVGSAEERAPGPRNETSLRVLRIGVPEHLRRGLEAGNLTSIQSIKEASGLEALRYLPMAGSQHYLRFVGTYAALDRAKLLLQGSIYRNPVDSHVATLSVDQLLIDADSFKPADPTHFAWIRLPEPLFVVSKARPDKPGPMMKRVAQVTECAIFSPRIGAANRMLQGSEQSVRLCLAGIQTAIDENRTWNGAPSAKIEVVETGLFENKPLIPQARNASPPPHENAADAQTQSESSAELNKQCTTAKTTEVSSVGHEQSPNADVKVAKQNRQGTPSKTANIVQVESEQGKTANTNVSFNEKKSRQQPEELPERQTSQKLGDEMRSALGHLTQPVALITSKMLGGPEQPNQPDQHQRHGMRGVTVSSFCTVTLEPVPVISFNLRVPSRTWDAISATGRLRVHLLTASPRGAAVAHAFTLPYEQPHEPFDRLQRMGALISHHRGRKVPPTLKWPGVVYAIMDARLMVEKCIRVGDHVVAVAEVVQVVPRDVAEAGALAYGMRGYRQLGGEIKPLEPETAESAEHKSAESESAILEPKQAVAQDARPVEETVDQATTDEELFERLAADEGETSDAPTAKLSSATTEASPRQAVPAPKDIIDLQPSSPLLDNHALRQVLKETEANYSTKGLPAQTAAWYPALADALNAIAGAYKKDPEATTTSQRTTSTSQAPDPPTDDIPNTPPNEAPSKVSDTSSRPWGLNGNSKPPSSRGFSTYARAFARHYSSSTPTPPHPPIPAKILKTTVADYLAHNPTHVLRYADLIELQRSAERMDLSLKEDYLTPEETTSLQHKARVARRTVARELAIRNVRDLSDMLDAGYVVPERALWLESSVEAGQAVLLEEAKLLRVEYEEGRLGLEEFEGLKGGLTGEYEGIETQLRRLRDLGEEDDVEGGGR